MLNYYQFLANIIACIHLAVALYLLSIPIVFFIKIIPKWYLKIQLGILSIAGICHFTTGVCPLTYAENYLRELGGGNKYEGNFLNHYAERFFHVSIPNQLVSNAIILLAILFIIMLVQSLLTKNTVELKMLPGKK